ncbi:regulator of chromatin subfamily A member 3-like 1 [Seminavis robusta]|uniref:Regulator of chromatin subfamily A member 3-like 1 n=1 Tax=Seminavis robusta TaxID=568900 RepID=A0A9N8HBY8_9STRA|nr:regulator of chromatin subfamily A member 3-like 1 [Seminavis robusta]|eukprot:Sro298_g110990.1 regulator of chromatin subfamily A member 3-like 1 (881) ;mRNA; f:2774-5772
MSTLPGDASETLSGKRPADAKIDEAAEEATMNTEDDFEEEDASALVATFQGTIVGIRYYKGTAHAGEYVSLVREPDNPYDANAIRVDNMAGDKVGHLKRQQAAILAPWMDRAGEHALSVEGTIPHQGNSFNMPVTVELITHAPEKELAAHAQQLEQQLKKSVGRKFQYRSALRTAGNNSTKAATGPTVESQEMMNWAARQAEELDQLFEQQSAQQLANLPAVSTPSQLQTTLLEYQQTGLGWLVRQDTQPKLPFYEKRKEQGRQVWHCSISNSSQAEEPKPFRGGMLCDEMGLGKTLQMISLILAAPPATATAPQCTLIVCPVSVMANWEQQIGMHVEEGALSVGIYQGPSRGNLLPQIKSGAINVLLVSYNTLASDYTKVFGKPNGKGPATKKRKVNSIFDQEMHRVVLDEAHTIRSTKTRVFHACSQLDARSRWALTGSPIINRCDDVHALLHFLRVQPLGDKKIFQRAISVPIQRGDDAGLACLRVAMSHVALRRSKATANVQLTEKTVQLNRVSFEGSEAHKEVYDALFGTVKMAFQAVLQDGENAVLGQYSHIFTKLMRLRQACCSAKLVPMEHRERAILIWKELQQRDLSKQLTAKEGLKLLEKLKGAFSELAELPECAVCLTEMEESQCVILKTCSHVFCDQCIAKVLSANPNCPLCRKGFQKSDMIKKSDASKAASTEGEEKDGDDKIPIDDDSIAKSPKIQALLATIKSMEPDSKGVIFSQFTSFLTLIGQALEEAGHTFVRLDGSMSAAKRSDAVRDFSSDEDNSPRFFLASLHAAGTGINLTRGTHACMMDVWWNAAIEEQAMDRIHRIGQTKPVTVHRFVMKDSLEERIVELQEAKSLQSKGALQKLKPEEQRRSRLRDLKGLLMIED